MFPVILKQAGQRSGYFYTAFDGVAGQTVYGTPWTLDGSGAVNPQPSNGPQLLTNNDFSAWSGDNPAGWFIEGETAPDPEVTERGSGQTHAGAGTGACNIYSSLTNSKPAIRQTVMTEGRYYRADVSITAYASGSLVLSPFGGQLWIAGVNAVGTYESTGWAFGSVPAIIRFGPLFASTDYTLDNVALYELSDHFMLWSLRYSYGRCVISFTRPDHTYIGLVLNYTDPENFASVFFTGSDEIRYGEVTGGSYTNIATLAAVYTPNASLDVTRHQDGTVDITYNGASLVTGAAASGHTSARHGIVGTHNSQAINDFLFTIAGVT